MNFKQYCKMFLLAIVGVLITTFLISILIVIFHSHFVTLIGTIVFLFFGIYFCLKCEDKLVRWIDK